MSFRNGDKSRSGRLRKQRIQKRMKTRALAASISEAGAKSETAVKKAARKIGSALAEVAVATHVAKPKKKSK